LIRFPIVSLCGRFLDVSEFRGLAESGFDIVQALSGGVLKSVSYALCFLRLGERDEGGDLLLEIEECFKTSIRKTQE